MPLPHDSIFQFNEGNIPSQYDALSGDILNRPLTQLLENDVSLKNDLDTSEGGVSSVVTSTGQVISKRDGVVSDIDTLQTTSLSIASGVSGATSDFNTKNGDVNSFRNDLGTSDTQGVRAQIIANALSLLTATNQVSSLVGETWDPQITDVGASNLIKDAKQPINKNGFLIGGLTLGPVGYSATGNCVVSAVSAFTKGFQGSYNGARPIPEASTQDEATASKPYFYGRWDSGPRTKEGGLFKSANSPSTYYRGDWSRAYNHEKAGCLLKIRKPAGGAHGFSNGCVIPMKHYCNTRKVRFKAYVWIDSGPKTFGFGPMYYRGTISVPHLKVWTPKDVVITTNGSTGKYWKILLPTASAQVIYIAMLGIYPVRGSGNAASTINVE